MMRSRLNEEALIRRILPAINPCREERAAAWREWQEGRGGSTLLRFIRLKNCSNEPDEDIYQDALAIAFQEVERGRYQPQAGVPFTAYLKGIARNKIRAALRKGGRWSWVALDDVSYALADATNHPERAFERSQQRKQFYDGIAQLSPGRQQVLARIIRGERTSEIAAAMQISEDLVRQHKSRSLRKLREIVIPEL